MISDAEKRQRALDVDDGERRMKAVGAALGFCPECSCEFLNNRPHAEDCPLRDVPRYAPRVFSRPDFPPDRVRIGRVVHLRPSGTFRTICDRDAWAANLAGRDARVNCKKCQKGEQR